MPSHLIMASSRHAPEASSVACPEERRPHTGGLADPGLRSLLGQALAGAVIGWAVLAGLVATDAVGIGTLLAQSDLGWLALLVLTLQFGAGFATFAVATSVALRATGTPQGRRRAEAAPFIARPVRARSKKVT
jgi:hypothetical protein